jgi:hypothetical protein
MTLMQLRKTFSADSYSVRDGVFTVRRAFFYRHGFDADQFADRVRQAFPNATIIDSGEVWKPFRGGASVKRGSHWYVVFTVPSTGVSS